MGLVNRCWYNATTSGLADFGVGVPLQGYFTPAQAGAINGVTYTYAAANLGQVEVGQGRYVNGLQRRSVIILSSSGNAKVNFLAPPQVMLTTAREDIGFLRVAGAEITSPITFFDISLPPDFFLFELRFSGLAFGQQEQLLTCAWSVDGGNTFLNDVINRDSYTNYVRDSSPAVPFTSFNDAVISAAPLLTSGNLGSGSLTIDPGGASSYPTLRGTSVDDAGSLLSWFAIANRGAMYPQTPGRINLLRVLPYAEENVNALISGDTIASMSWSLFGIL